MGPKEQKKSTKVLADIRSDEGEVEISSPRSISLAFKLKGDCSELGDCIFLVVFNGQTIADVKWDDNLNLEADISQYNLKDPNIQMLIADQPLILLLRQVVGKAAKDPDPLINVDNFAGATVDLFPLLIGEEYIETNVYLASITTGDNVGYLVEVYARLNGAIENTKVPLTLTLISSHCLPLVKEGTVYIAAIGLDQVIEPIPINFGMSLSNANAKKIVWATASTAGQAANTALCVPQEDTFIPENFEPTENSNSQSVYWNSMKRVLVDVNLLRDRLDSPLLIEVAGVPKVGKPEARGRYMGFLDAGVLLEPGQFGVTVSTKLHYFNEAFLPENVAPLLEILPTSAKASARDSDLVLDEMGHIAFVKIRFDLYEPLIPKLKVASLFDAIGFSVTEGYYAPVEELYVDMPPEDTRIDTRRIRNEGVAMAIHKELSGLACRGVVPMNQSIKRSAASRLLTRVRSMLKQFPPGDCSYFDWQEVVTRHHSASRYAVTASFAPQPPPLRPPAHTASARARIALDERIADAHLDTSLLIAPNHPRALLSKALRCLELEHNKEAKTYLQKALGSQNRNKFLLWIYGAQEFNKGVNGANLASAAFRIAVKGDYSDGTSNTIGWAALHTLYHCSNNPYAAFVAARKMRKFYELGVDWKKFLDRWIETSGEEEVFWIPYVINSNDPILCASAFFLCLRCYDFSEKLLECVENKCIYRGSRLKISPKAGPDCFYLRAASLLVRHQLDKAIMVTNEGIKKFGPSQIMSQMQNTCLAYAAGWDGICETAFKKAELAGSELPPALLLQASLGGMKTNPKSALQRAARSHKLAPNAHSALALGRIYRELNEKKLAERWAAAAVNLEPLLSDGWAYLGIMAMEERDTDKARALLRTAKQAGPISKDIEAELHELMGAFEVEKLPETLVKNLCLCDYN